MKKILIFILMLVLAMSLSACGGSEEITMQEIHNASNIEALLEKHESVHVEYIADGVLYKEIYKGDYGYFFFNAGGEYYGFPYDVAYLTTADCHDYFYQGDEELYGRAVIISSEGLKTYDYEIEAGFAFEGDGLNENIVSVEEKDGILTVKTHLEEEAPESTGMEGILISNSIYNLDAKTRELISYNTVLEYENGMVFVVDMNFIYDGEIPERMKTFVEYDNSEDLRTITVVTNPGTENEKTESIQLPKGIYISFEPYIDETADFSDPNFDPFTAFELYSDADCTEAFVLPEDYDSDFTVYIKWVE